MLRNNLLFLALWCTVVLNEVLSLNAQESAPMKELLSGSSILNEVLSLNAQECIDEPFDRASDPSSMKS